jgi:transcriptional regulator with XRE-family HTH domain
LQTLGLSEPVNAKRGDPPQSIPVDPALRAALARNLRAARAAAGLSQQDLAKLCDLSSRYISRIENTDANVSLDVLALLARYLKTTPLALLRPPNSEPS